MKVTTTTLLFFTTSVAGVAAFSPPISKRGVNTASFITTLEASTLGGGESGQPIFDPLGLYPKDSPERQSGLIQPMESAIINEETDRVVIDPLSLYKGEKESEVNKSTAMSPSLPFLKRPDMLDGTLPGDRGFDPLNFSSDASALAWYRESELKHARLAMLAVVGWPLAELAHNNLASRFDLPSVLAGGNGDRVPSVLNGGLEKTSPLFWVGAISAAAALEFISTKNDNENDARRPGDFGFDPLGWMSKEGKHTEKKNFFLQESELFNGRLAMLAVTGFALQEFALRSPVVEQTPIFFKSFGEVASQLLASGAATSV